jgi:hypothetical protein
MIKKGFKVLNTILGTPYYAVLKLLDLGFKGIKKLPKILLVLIKWFIDAVKESIAQIFTLLGFFIAWFTLTGTAQDIVGIAIVVSIIIWLVTIRLRD